MTYSNSPLVNYTLISPNKNATRIHPKYNPSGEIDGITIHHMAGNLSVEACARLFHNPQRQGSSNYGIGTDGRIGLYVDEKHRAWTSGSPANDYKKITIEVANDTREPNWHVSDKALESCINLCVDICKRNNIKKLNYTGDTSGNLTMHCWFQATGCPGPYLKSKFAYIADEVNKRLNQETTKPVDENSGYETYTVVHGDSLWSIAKKFYGDGSKYPQLKSLNGLSSNVIYSGTVLKIRKKPVEAAKPIEEPKPAPAPAPVTPKPERKSNEQLAKEVLEGKWGSGSDRKKALTNAGYDYSAVQGIVNQMVKGTYAPSKPAKKSNEEVARLVINGQYGNGAARKAKLESEGYNYREVQAIVNKLLS